MKSTIKNSIYTAILICITSNTFAQIENIEVGEYTTINKLYTGLYARTISPIDTLNLTNVVSYRLGILATHRFNDIFSVSTQGAFQIATGSDFTSIGDFELVTKISDKWQIRVGSLTTPITFIRPNPITWQSQSETYAQSRILVQRPGALTTYRFSDDFAVTYGIHYQNGLWAHHSRINFNNFMLGGFVQQDGEYFGVLDYKNDRLQGIINFSSIEDEWATSLFYGINERYTIFADTNYRTDAGKTEVASFGVRSYYFSHKLPIKGFLALEYDFAAEIAFAELFVHLN